MSKIKTFSHERKKRERGERVEERPTGRRERFYNLLKNRIRNVLREKRHMDMEHSDVTWHKPINGDDVEYT